MTLFLTFSPLSFERSNQSDKIYYQRILSLLRESSPASAFAKETLNQLANGEGPIMRTLDRPFPMHPSERNKVNIFIQSFLTLSETKPATIEAIFEKEVCLATEFLNDSMNQVEEKI